MGFFEAVQTAFSKFIVFDGRARRSEYWYFGLFVFVSSLILGILSGMFLSESLASMVSRVWNMAVTIPSVAVGVRRLHDIGKPGTWMLIGLIPIIGQIILLVWMVKDSEPYDNQYGPNPKADGVYRY